ncbi:MAG TPA: arginine deiminase-related protein [Steroidobacteraceae bacterium]|nr:arginine deiminase-related protein [Steroidobacteraceae bacterium]
MPLASESGRQTADAVLMVRPARFGWNRETADSNRFQRSGATPGDATAVLREFDGLAARLADAGVEVVVAGDSPEPAKPDACFPNNWVSFHADGSVVLYPMMAPTRRAERRPEPIVEVEHAGFRVARTIDLSALEARGEFLEGTGSLVLDRKRRIAYACRSPRTTAGALAEFSAALGYRVVAFDALGPDGRPAYHTNVLMAIGTGFAVICADAIPDPERRTTVLDELGRGVGEVISIDVSEMNGFAGNLLALSARDGAALVAMSGAALAALAPARRRQLERHGALIVADIPTIERLGGGSVRCMLAEVFLPRLPER